MTNECMAANTHEQCMCMRRIGVASGLCYQTGHTMHASVAGEVAVLNTYGRLHQLAMRCRVCAHECVMQLPQAGSSAEA